MWVVAPRYARFRSIDGEFVALMRRVAANPKVLDVLALQGLGPSLDRLLGLLEKIQKALGEYLERQRAAFARFYFVGDEDLLEIIGNGKDPVKLQARSQNKPRTCNLRIPQRSC